MTSAQISLFVLGKHLVLKASEPSKGKKGKKPWSELKEMGAKEYEEYLKGRI